MAQRRIPLSGKEVSDIGAQIEQVAKGSDNLAGRLQSVLMSSRNMSRGVASEFRKVHKQIISQARQQESMIVRLQKAQARGAPVDQKKLVFLQRELAVNKRKIQILDRVNVRSEQQTGIMGRLVTRMKSMISVTGILSTAWGILVKGFDNFINLSQKWQAAMGQIAQATGASASQFRQMRGQVAQAATEFGRLTGEVDGIEHGGQFVNELNTSVRNLGDITPQIQHQIFELSRGFGMGTENAVSFMRTINAIQPGTNLEDFGADMIRFAESIGAQAGVLMRDWNDARASIAQFGEQGNRVFQQAALMANKFGFETKKIFDMMKNFDQFSSAADQVNTLNAVLGTSLSSYELMIEQDPSKRLEMIRSEIRDMGMDWNNMSRQQRMAIAASVNLSEDEAARVFAQGNSLEDLENQQRAAAARQESDARTQRSNQQLMNELLLRTKDVFETIGRAIQRLWNSFSMLLAPIFGEVNKGLTGLIDKVTSWINAARQNEQVKRIIKEVGIKIREVFHWLQQSIPTWEELQKYGATAWKTIEDWTNKAWIMIKEVAKYVKVTLIPWILELVEQWRAVAPSIQEVWDKIKWGYNSIIKPYFTLYFKMIKHAWEGMQYFGNIVHIVMTSIENAVGSVIDGFSSFFGPNGTLIQGVNLLRNQVADVIENIARIPGVGLIAPELVGQVAGAIRPGAVPTTPEQTQRALTNAGIPQALAQPNISFTAAQGAMQTSVPGTIVGTTSTAIQSAPVTAPTVQTPRSVTVPAGNTRIDIVATDVVLNGRVVGRAMFEISQRT